MNSETGIVKGNTYKPCESYTGTAYYVSNNGSDENDGMSQDTPWASIARVVSTEFKAGDAVFFERGGTWRGQPFLECQPNTRVYEWWTGKGYVSLDMNYVKNDWNGFGYEVKSKGKLFSIPDSLM